MPTEQKKGVKASYLCHPLLLGRLSSPSPCSPSLLPSKQSGKCLWGLFYVIPLSPSLRSSPSFTFIGNFNPFFLALAISNRPRFAVGKTRSCYEYERKTTRSFFFFFSLPLSLFCCPYLDYGGVEGKLGPFRIFISSQGMPLGCRGVLLII